MINFIVKKLKLNLYEILLFMMIFLPDFNYFRLEDIIIISVILFEIINKKRIVIPKTVAIYFILFIIVYSLSITNYILFINQGIDLMTGLKEIVRSVKILFIFIIFQKKIVYFKMPNLNKFVFYSVIIVLVEIMQIYNLFNINNIIITFYKPGIAQYYNISSYAIKYGMFRATATFYNPNILASFLLISFIVVINMYKKNNRIITLISLITISAGIFLSQSNTGILGILAIIFVLYIIELKRKNKSNNAIIAISIFTIVLLFSVNILITKYNLARDEERSIYQIVASREYAYTKFLEIFNKYPILGMSPIFAKDYPYDSEYFFILINYGLLGLIIYLKAIITLLRRLKCYFKIEADEIIILILLVPFIGMTNGFVFSNRIFPIYLIIFNYFISKNEKCI